MKIEFDTANMSPLDFEVLAVLGSAATAPAVEATEATTPVKKAAAKKAAPAAKKAEPEPEPEPENVEDLRDAAVARASELLSSGERERVMAALKAAGAPRVSEIPAEALEGFLQALTD